MSRSLLAALLALGVSACKAVEADTTGACGEDGLLLTHDAISPVRYGTDAHRDPTVEIRFESRGTCLGESDTFWIRWTGATPDLIEPEGEIDTTTAKLTFLTDLRLRAIRWREADLTMPFERTQDVFTFSAILAGQPVGDFECRAPKGILACGPVVP